MENIGTGQKNKDPSSLEPLILLNRGDVIRTLTRIQEAYRKEVCSILLYKEPLQEPLYLSYIESEQKSRVPFLVEPLIYCIGITGLELYTAKSRIV